MQTHRGHFRRSDTARFLYGAVNNYRLRSAVTALPAGGTPDPTSGVAPLAVDAVPAPAGTLVLNGRSSWPGIAGGGMSAKDDAGGYAVDSRATCYGRDLPATEIAGEAKKSAFLFDGINPQSTPFGTTIVGAETFALGDHVVASESVDALGRTGETVETAVTAT